MEYSISPEQVDEAIRGLMGGEGVSDDIDYASVMLSRVSRGMDEVWPDITHQELLPVAFMTGFLSLKSDGEYATTYLGGYFGDGEVLETAPLLASVRYWRLGRRGQDFDYERNYTLRNPAISSEVLKDKQRDMYLKRCCEQKLPSIALIELVPLCDGEEVVTEGAVGKLFYPCMLAPGMLLAEMQRAIEIMGDGR